MISADLFQNVFLGLFAAVWGGKVVVSKRQSKVLDDPLTKSHHDEVCDLKLGPMKNDIAEIKGLCREIHGKLP